MTTILPKVLAAGGGFLLAVLWFDLMFDAQARRLDGSEGELRLASIADYYRRVTIEAFPANRLVATVMLVVVGGCIWQLITGDGGRGRALLCLVLTAGPVGLAWARILPNAMRLGARTDSLDEQRRLARSILWDHVLCALAIVAFLSLQLSI